MKNVKIIVAAVVLMVLVYACSTVPIIGRKQLNLLPESQNGIDEFNQL